MNNSQILLLVLLAISSYFYFNQNTNLDNIKNILLPGVYNVERYELGEKYNGQIYIDSDKCRLNYVSNYGKGVKVGYSDGNHFYKQIHGGVLHEITHNSDIEYIPGGYIDRDYSTISMKNRQKYPVERLVKKIPGGFTWTTYVINNNGTKTPVIKAIATRI